MLRAAFACHIVPKPASGTCATAGLPNTDGPDEDFGQARRTANPSCRSEIQCCRDREESAPASASTASAFSAHVKAILRQQDRKAFNSRMADEPSGTAQNGNLDKVFDREQSEGSYFKTMLVNDRTAGIRRGCLHSEIGSII